MPGLNIECDIVYATVIALTAWRQLRDRWADGNQSDAPGNLTTRSSGHGLRHPHHATPGNGFIYLMLLRICGIRFDIGTLYTLPPIGSDKAGANHDAGDKNRWSRNTDLMQHQELNVLHRPVSAVACSLA